MKINRRPFIIDVEASGFGHLSYPIEIGLALEEDDRYCSLIRPCRTWTHWDNTSESIHHISRDLLLQKGKPICRVAEELNSLLGVLTVYSDGWGVDKPWVIRLFERAGMAMTFHISPLEMILSEMQMEIWHETKNRVIEETGFKRHRASTDAFIIQETYVRTFKRSQNR